MLVVSLKNYVAAMLPGNNDPLSPVMRQMRGSPPRTDANERGHLPSFHSDHSLTAIFATFPCRAECARPDYQHTETFCPPCVYVRALSKCRSICSKPPGPRQRPQTPSYTHEHRRNQIQPRPSFTPQAMQVVSTLSKPTQAPVGRGRLMLK